MSTISVLLSLNFRVWISSNQNVVLIGYDILIDCFNKYEYKTRTRTFYDRKAKPYNFLINKKGDHNTHLNTVNRNLFSKHWHTSYNTSVHPSIVMHWNTVSIAKPKLSKFVIPSLGPIQPSLHCKVVFPQLKPFSSVEQGWASSTISSEKY
jgi:hypothetical protein